ncbi:hypothetical protein Thermo_00131 [Thermoplasmatales archaeon]|nr:hypothetical protein Thermo_00131 [Thermoplasmatales archaeon]
MSDDNSAESFESEVKLREYSYTATTVSGNVAFIIENYPILYGKNSGKQISIGIVLPKDYPSAAPAGIHIKWRQDLQNKPTNIVKSEMGSGWERMSRVVQNWVPGRRRAELFFAQVDKWLEA